MKLIPVHVVIKSYQSIEDLEFDVAGFTCVTGKTNIGKSAIMRAVSGALLNKPVTNLVRSGSKSCSVRLQSEQWGLLWEKAEKGLNRYTIDGKAERLENVGQRQPEPVAAMGFSSVRVGDRDLYPWYASQWTPVFLLDEGGPTVTQFISEISGLDVLQNAISLGLKSKKKALDDAKIASAEADQLRVKLQRVDNLDELITMTKELESQAESIAEYEKRVARGKELDATIVEAVSMIDVLHHVEGVHIPANGMVGEIETTLKMYHRWLKLEEAAKAVIALHGKKTDIPEAPCAEHDTWMKVRKYAVVDGLKLSVKKLEPIERMTLPSVVDKTGIDKLKRGKAILEQVRRLNKTVSLLSSTVSLPISPDIGQLHKTAQAKTLLGEIETAQSDMARFGKELVQVDDDLAGVLRELQKIPSCPTCSRPVVSNHVHGAGAGGEES